MPWVEEPEKKAFYATPQPCPQTINNPKDIASSTETAELGSILDRVKPKTIKIGFHSFPD